MAGLMILSGLVDYLLTGKVAALVAAAIAVTIMTPKVEDSEE